jgi:hypothetical protein
MPSMNAMRFFRRSLKRSANIIRRVGRSTRSLTRSTLRRGTNIARRVGRTTRRTLRIRRRQ